MRRWSGLSPVGILALGLLACARDERLDLVWDRETRNSGLACQLDGLALSRRALSNPYQSPTGASVSLVVELARLPDGSTDCSGSGIRETCVVAASCPVEPKTRLCFESIGVPTTRTGSDVVVDRDGMINRLTVALNGEQLYSSAPNGLFTLRIYATAQTCETLLAEPTAAPDRTQLVGCAQSCPINFPGENGEITVRLIDPTAGTDCELEVAACAAGGK